MTQKSLCFLLVISVLFTSCIPLNDLVYLQDKKGVTSENAIMAIQAKPYRLQTSDVLSVIIKASDSKLVTIFSQSLENSNINSKSDQGLYFDGFTVDDHGNIRVPILGEVNVIGYTIEEVRAKIEKLLLEQYFKEEANIFVTVKLAGFRYTINGEVNSTGTKVVYKDNLTIMEAIANAGDITITGNRKAVTVMRQLPTGIEMHDIDLTDVNVIKSPYYNLQPNDYIYVKPVKQKTWGTGKTGLESIGTIITLLSLATTTYLLLKL